MTAAKRGCLFFGRQLTSQIGGVEFYLFKYPYQGNNLRATDTDKDVKLELYRLSSIRFEVFEGYCWMEGVQWCQRDSEAEAIE